MYNAGQTNLFTGVEELLFISTLHRVTWCSARKPLVSYLLLVARLLSTAVNWSPFRPE